ncbi:molybdopterin oxidoreductase family protein [Pseudonocardiaceae bacterium YIM PH 21723]|nr:molybdopterin oxidoreductase family protein [Pseudonocardiaceae bacterium YIM PH 21723]
MARERVELGEPKKSTCILCECNCGIEIQLDGRRFAKIRGDNDNPASRGYTCEKALRLDHYQNFAHRLTTPLRRRPDGEYEPIDWDTAIREIAGKLAEIRDAHGGDSIFFYGGGGQGNHLGGLYMQALRGALKSQFYANAVSQEKTGEAWVDGLMFQAHPRPGDLADAQCVVLVGKNPWQSHGLPHARVTLKNLKADPERTLIVLDPRRSESAAMADFHIQLKPGTDAWALAAMCAILVQENLIDRSFVDERTSGMEPVLALLSTVDITTHAAKCGVDEDLLRGAARAIAAAGSVATAEDLGIQQAPNSTLCSYLQRLLWVLTGNFGKPGTMAAHSIFTAVVGAAEFLPPDRESRRLDLGERLVRTAAGVLPFVLGVVGRWPWAGRRMDRIVRLVLNRAVMPLLIRLISDRSKLSGVLLRLMRGMTGLFSIGVPRATVTPVTGARIIAGVIPGASIVDEILTDHPDRFRAMWVDSSNPAHSMPESARFKQAMAALDLTVVVDVALTETGRNADYVLPASTQYEKTEMCFFNFEFPRNSIHMRTAVLDPMPGTLPEPEIYGGVIDALGTVDEATFDRLRRARRAGRATLTADVLMMAMQDPWNGWLATHLLRKIMGEEMPAGMEAAAPFWIPSVLAAVTFPKAMRRAGHAGSGLEQAENLFNALIGTRGGIVFTQDEWADAWSHIHTPGRRIRAVPELLPEIEALAHREEKWTSEEFPFVLAAGERRAFTANVIMRDPAWRRRDAQGALRMNPQDAERLGVTADSRVRVVTEAGSAETIVELTDTLLPGNITLPNGMGTEAGGERTGVAPNDLTTGRYRDPIAGTPWHKHVPARVEVLAD